MTLSGMKTATKNHPTSSSVSLDEIGVLLGAWAHPDDEAYASAGLMSLARSAGNRVVVATATRGEHGTQDPHTWPAQRPPIIRPCLIG